MFFMLFKKKSEFEKEVIGYEQALKGKGLEIKGPIGMTLNMVHRSFKDEFNQLSEFLQESQEIQDDYLRKLIETSETYRAKGYNGAAAAAHLFGLYLMSALVRDSAAHKRAIALMTELSEAGYMISD